MALPLDSTLPSGFYISVFSILNHVDHLASVPNLYIATITDFLPVASFIIPVSS